MLSSDAKTVCERDMCAGCMACMDSCAHGAVHIEDTMEAFNAVIDADKCVDCGACERACPIANVAPKAAPVAWRQGWARDPELRAQSTSGGYATAIARAFVARGGLVCGCVQQDGSFIFKLTDDARDLGRMQGTKYVKSDAVGAYCDVRAALRQGREVLFVGLPCQAAAMRRFVGRAGDRLYAIDLICHGSTSPKLLCGYLDAKGMPLKGELILDFRKKVQYQLRYRGAETVGRPGVRDRYSTAFLCGLTYTRGCYSCPYACGERTSDLTLGDSWGTELEDEMVRGISLALVMNERGQELLRMADVEALPVGAERALANNKQLQKPSDLPAGRAALFEGLATGKSLDALVFRARPKECMKYMLKDFLVSLGFFGGE